MAEMLIGFVVVGLSVAGLGLGLICGGRAVRSCGRGDCACGPGKARGKASP